VFRASHIAWAAENLRRLEPHVSCCEQHQSTNIPGIQVPGEHAELVRKSAQHVENATKFFHTLCVLWTGTWWFSSWSHSSPCLLERLHMSALEGRCDLTVLCYILPSSCLSFSSQFSEQAKIGSAVTTFSHDCQLLCGRCQGESSADFSTWTTPLWSGRVGCTSWKSSWANWIMFTRTSNLSCRLREMTTFPSKVPIHPYTPPFCEQEGCAFHCATQDQSSVWLWESWSCVGVLLRLSGKRDTAKEISLACASSSLEVVLEFFCAFQGREIQPKRIH
jgi:hypothetical protein